MPNNRDVLTATPSQWAEEYRRGGIPSSVRSRPSNVVVDFLSTVRKELPAAKRALDIGSGAGRNAVYVAEQGYVVHAIDYSGPQVDALRAVVAARPELKLEATRGSVVEPWPWDDAWADFAIDTFCFKHQIETSGIATYVSELRRCLRPGGLFLLFLAMREDGYYKQFATSQQHGPGLIIVDEGNGIASRLYSWGEVESLFEGFDIVRAEEKISVNEMHGRSYQRRSGVWYLRRI